MSLTKFDLNYYHNTYFVCYLNERDAYIFDNIIIYSKDTY